MNDRHRVDTINDDQLSQLYDNLDRYEEVVGELNQANTGLARKAGYAEAAVARVTDLQAQWLAAGPPPLGVPLARWWDTRLVELRGAIRPAAEEQRLVESGVDTPGCDCDHHGMGVSWHGDDCPWRRSVLEESRPERTPSQLPGLREQLADATVPLLLDTLPKVIARSRGYEVADAVMTLLYREWPWLRAEAEDAAPAPKDGHREQLHAAIESEVYEYRERTMFWPEGGITTEIARLATRGAMEVRDAELETLRAKVAEFDHIINWHTTCASCARILDSAYAETVRAEKAEERRDQLAATLGEVLRHFVHKGHPGEPCLGVGWVSVRTVDRWRGILNPPTPPAAT